MVLTFSRGGVYILAVAVVIYYLVLRRPNMKTVGVIVLFSAISYVVYYATISTTEGKIVDRYADVDTSNRDRLARLGWEMFEDNFYWGVGTGNFYLEVEKTDFGKQSGAHNEFIRAAAEHGILGILFWGLFVLGCAFQATFGRGSQARNTRALRLVFLLLAFSSMTYNGNKLLVQPFLIMLALSAFAGEYSPAMLRHRMLRRSRKYYGQGRLPETFPSPAAAMTSSNQINS
jgi:O-antigen ligase